MPDKMQSPTYILASKSPRRQELMKLMGLDYELVLKEVDESYPDTLPLREVPVYIAEQKAKAFDGDAGNAIVITADTIVLLGDQILGKPEGLAGAKAMLKQLSGNMHEVITGVALLTPKQGMITFSEVTKVYFNPLTTEQIEYYVDQYQPLDKAGSYGIQEWIGLIGIAKIEGSYTNVVGLPTERLYKELQQLL